MIKEKSKIWQKTSLLLGRFFVAFSPFPAGFYTISSLVLAAIAVFCACFHHFVIAIVLFLIAGIFDVIDGSVARAQNRASNLGAFVDGTVDRFVDFAIIFSYFFCEIQALYLNLDQLICIASFVVILPSFIVAYANHRGAVCDDNETLIWRVMNRGEMFFFMIGVLVTSLFSPYWAGFLLMLLIFLASITIIQTIILTIYHAQGHRSST